MKLNATMSETASAKQIVIAMSLNMTPAMPGTKRIGTKTEIVVSVEAVTATDTVRAPSMDALHASMPSSRSRKMFSRTTMALSTSMPTASARPAIDRMFNVMSA